MGKTYVTGDLNSRTARIADISEFDGYLDFYDDTQNNSFNNGPFTSEQNQLPVRQNKDHVIDHNGQKLISLCKATEHIIANGRLHKDREGNFTFCSSRGLSVTDYLLCRISDIDSISNFEILNWNEFSDHAPIYFTFIKQHDSIPVRTKASSINERTFQQKIIFSEDKVPEYEEILRRNIHHLEKNTNVSSEIENLVQFLSQNAVKVFGKDFKVKENNSGTQNKQYGKPKWFDEKCYTAKQEFRNARNIFTKNKTDETRTAFVKTRTKYNRVRQIAKRRFKLNEGQRLENIAKLQPKKFWKSIKRCYTKPASKNIDVDMKDLYNHFNTLLGQVPENNNANDIEFQDIQDNELDSKITEQEIRQAVFNQKSGKSPGPDELTAELIKASYDIISPHLTSILNRLFDNSEYPESWGLGYIVPIYKGGDSKLAQNYRGITLNNILAKIYSQVLLNRLTAWTEKHEKISECQFGYQKGKSTTDCIFILHSIISKVLHSGQKLYTVFIDYGKCFDKINHSFLWQKLISENVSSKMTKAIKVCIP